MRGINRQLRELAILVGVAVVVLAVAMVSQYGANAELIGAIVCGGLVVLVALAATPAKRPARSSRAWFDPQAPRRPARPLSTMLPRAPAPPQRRSAPPSTTIIPGRQARAPADGLPQVISIKKAWIVDGDTIDDNATRIRYRLENIDAPETKYAACAAEAHMGERSKWTAYELIKAANNVEAHTTGRIDQYGRTIARIKLDGKDLGEMLIARGFARPWTGARENWCGVDGPLNALARTCYGRPICLDCAKRPDRPSA